MNTKTRTANSMKKETAYSPAPQPISKKKKKSGEEQWEQALATPGSEALLTLLVAEVDKDFEAGKIEEGDW
ncbi:MAG: hypothetical protein IT211_10555 [Armatimonadetes bacterium]|nr:hypothetical protein [Armatimonadota bacterium]